MPHKYVQIQGVATYLHHRGPTTLPEAAPDTSRGQVVVALHDVGGNGACFDGLLDALATSHSPMAFDGPGHARSGQLDSLGDIATMARFAVALVRKLGLRPVVWLGEGMGAAVAVEAARQAPDVSLAVVLCAPPARDPGTAEAIAALGKVVAGKARRQFDSTGYAPDTSREVFTRAFSEWVKTDPRVTLGDLNALHAWDEGNLDLALPALVASGDAGDGEAADAWARRLAHARRVTIAGAGRHLALERPDELASAIHSFLSEAVPGGSA